MKAHSTTTLHPATAYNAIPMSCPIYPPTHPIPMPSSFNPQTLTQKQTSPPFHPTTPLQDAVLLVNAVTPQHFSAASQALSGVCPPLSAAAALLSSPAADAAAARGLLVQLVGLIRQLDLAQGGGHTRAADVLQLYAATQVHGVF